MQELSDEAFIAIPRYGFIKNYEDLSTYIDQEYLKYLKAISGLNEGFSKMEKEHKTQLADFEKENHWEEPMTVRGIYLDSLKVLFYCEENIHNYSPKNILYRNIRKIPDKELKKLFINIFEFRGSFDTFEIRPYSRYKVSGGP